MMDTPQPATAQPEPVTRFLDAFRASLEQGTLAKLVLSSYHGTETDLKKIVIRPLALKDGKHLSFVHTHTTRDITKNLPEAAGLARIAELLGVQFRSAHLLTQTEDFHLEFSQKGKPRLTRGTATSSLAPATGHDRKKNRLLDHRKPFLHALGITDTAQRIIPAMAHKWKQINKFLEIFSQAVADSPLAEQKRVEVVDFGCGKGYLTFAVHDLLTQTLQREASITGIELRPELVELCNGVATREHCAGLQFKQGALGGYAPEKLDVLIALHACDTATDLALHLGIRSGASLILCAPCCHKELRPQLQSPEVLRPLLRYGVHAAQEADMLTDTLRAMLLEAYGYQVKVFEFIALEHTDKNKLILGLKRPHPTTPAAEIWQQLAALKNFYGIREQKLEMLLR
ncbi:MAG: SAM-dependent methyltransferase [Kiritimatiellaeota bacterium]|nr:SAM-dependent methyltransferase [Kiritimatiellota bacterium]